MKIKTSLFCFLLLPLALYAQPYSWQNPPLLPDPVLTPGVSLTNITAATVCQKGYANVLNGGVRDVPESVKKQVFIEYFGVVPPNPGNFEIDHLRPIEDGGSNDPKNLWPQSYIAPVWGAHVKDRLENKIHEMICQSLDSSNDETATVLMVKLQGEISSNWTNAYVQYLGAPQ